MKEDKTDNGEFKLWTKDRLTFKVHNTSSRLHLLSWTKKAKSSAIWFIDLNQNYLMWFKVDKKLDVWH